MQKRLHPFHEISCPVCDGESIADSPADIGTEMRRAIRERVVAGESDFAIKNYLTSHFGDAILIPSPPTPVPKN
jgi:cytochrome c-type biogenesis protein CcmH